MTAQHVMIEVRDVGLEFPRRMPRGPGEPPTAIERFLRRPSYRTFTALDGVSFDVHQGEVVGIVGHNGAGKSTLLRVMAGIYRPDRGSVRVGGHVSLLAGVGVGFNVNLSGRENVYLYGSILGKPRAEMDAAMDAIVEFAELQEFIEEPVKTYSSGMRARLGFSVATQICPEILLVDEVLAVGDVRFKERSMQRIKDMVAAAGTVVVASHSFPTVREVCTRVLFFERGRLIMEGEPDAVIDRYVREQHAGAPRSASGA